MKLFLGEMYGTPEPPKEEQHFYYVTQSGRLLETWQHGDYPAWKWGSLSEMPTVDESDKTEMTEEMQILLPWEI